MVLTNLKKLRKAKGLKQKELGAFVGVTESAISQMENGRRSASFEVALKLAEALDCEMADLISQRANRPGAAEYVTFPVIGEVAAGYDHYADEDWTNGEVDIPVSWLNGKSLEEFFVLRVSGDSMYPSYQAGDIVLVLRQDTMDHSGQIGVVQYDGDKGTIKRIEYADGEKWVRLSPINPQFPPITLRGDQLLGYRVMGIPKMVIRKV